ncbi:l-aminoadipate-semialdehyde dehydrogenase [Lichtheimia corymbifera JMRC:FSU:9682]|uniref:L-aminoadipate-semialdehyde dehydrogenase n=1 Tax=Lichtheimia corymbifera JMRC:FSU:9682 TaxID=1263082 RepID=A0A068RL58_9FUNG|nr:l-aminoadipate-semialdehyde dehydrogenase [Lichtheimia corymbifera JMRC:FSU:9682]
MIDEVQGIVSKANKDAPSHSTILPQMVYILPLEKRLPSTDKGTIMRKHAIREYESAINKMYDDFLNGAADQPSDMRGSTSGMTLEQIESFLVRTASQVLQIKEDVLASNKQESLFDHGLNSLLAIQLRNRISSSFGTVPSNFIFEHPTIESAAQSLHSSDETVDNSEERYRDTQQLLEDYIARAKDDFAQCKTADDDPRAAEGHVILLTGATGSLGSFMLSRLLQCSNVKKVYCLVRGQQDRLMDRLNSAFRDRFLDTRLLENGKVEALPMKLNEDYLGWSKDTYDRLKQQVTIVQACAWLLDFNQPIAHFDKECIKGLYNLLKFAHRPINPMHVHTISSVSATAAMKSPIQEVVAPDDPHVAMPMGYAQSKYVIEHLFYFLSKEKGFPCTIERLGQVCGDTQRGYWHNSEQYPLMMVGGGAEMKKMPDLGNMVIDWIPVDYAAASIVQIMLTTASNNTGSPEQVYHIVNPNMVTWRDVLEAMRVSGIQFDIVTPEQWVEDLSEHEDNPAYRLISFYEANFVGEAMSMPVWETKQTVKVAPMLKQAPAFGPDLMNKYLHYWRSIGFYK